MMMKTARFGAGVLLAIALVLVSLPGATAKIVLDLDCGGPGATDLRNTLIPGSRKKTGGSQAIEGTEEDDRFRTYRRTLPGINDFTYKLDSLPNGPATLILEFAEYSASICNVGAGGRTFSVAVNEVNVLTDFDVFVAGGSKCKVAVVEEIPVTIADGKLDVKFIRGVNEPMISGIKVDSDQDVVTTTPPPVTTIPSGTTVAPGCKVGNTGSFTHGAHAVPGSYPPKINANSPVSYVDTDGDGFETVMISGEGSHTHVVDTSNPLDPQPGTIVSFKWSIEGTGEVVSTDLSFSYNFPIGVTTLVLEIEDSVCDVSDAITTVTVTGAISQGAYCYYYNSQALPPGESLESDGNLKPTFGFEYVKDFGGELPAPPTSFGSDTFSARCFVLYETAIDSEATALSVSTGGTGDARIYKSSKLIGSSSVEPLAAGLCLIEVQYLRTSTAQPPQLSFLVNGTSVPLSSMSYDRSLVLPVLASISPSSGPAAGGGNAIITGYGFYSEPFVTFGDDNPDAVEASPMDFIPTRFNVQIPKAVSQGPVAVTAASFLGGLPSNSLEYVYDEGVEPIKFSETVVTENGATFQSTLTTSIAVFGDSWYLGRVGGFIRKITVSADLEVTSSCDSPTLSDPKYSKDGIPAEVDIFGIGFDPRDTVGRPYVTAGTIYFLTRRKVDPTNMDVHMNGRIERFGPGNGCLVYESRVVSGLPMADHDHGPSGFDWGNDGTMYITSAGVTNGGLPGALFGNMYEVRVPKFVCYFPILIYVVSRSPCPNTNMYPFVCHIPFLMPYLHAHVSILTSPFLDPSGTWTCNVSFRLPCSFVVSFIDVHVSILTSPSSSAFFYINAVCCHFDFESRCCRL